MRLHSFANASSLAILQALRRWVLVAAVLALSACSFLGAGKSHVNSQLAENASATAPSADEERHRITTERRAAEQLYTAEVVDCYQLFMVNGCKLQAKKKRDPVLAELRRQEVVLNDDERKTKGVLQLQKLEEKVSFEAVTQAEEQRQQRITTALENQQRRDDNPRTPPTPKAPSAEPLAKVAPAPSVRQPKPVKQNDSTAALASFANKQQQAGQHAVDLQDARQRRQKPLSEPLPALGTAPTALNPKLTQ